MTTVAGDNIHNIALEGNFDDCQTAVKKLFGDPGLIARLSEMDIPFSSANSINWGRLCPQIVYYFKAAFDVGRRTFTNVEDDREKP